ncbi:MAG: glycoside hydrolase family 88 protein [Bacteroidales bacterium]|nr:glycoside hydrolase family 88 protein [Bacteroidales bacterium]
MKGMMKPLCFAAGLVLAAACARPVSLADEALDYCVKKVTGVQERLGADYGESPRNIAPGDCRWNLTPVCQENWTMGFWPGILWYAYEASGDAALETAARGYTEALDFIARQPAYDHDIGFIMFPSFGNGFRLTGDPAYKEAVLATAERLAALFNPAVGTILSWPREVPNFGGHNTIMDNMLNLETLFWAAENGGDPAWKDIAVTHADTTMRYNFRPDGTSYHVAVFDAETGAYRYSCTHQGYADDSMWARGQAWGIYGYTMVYRFTREPRFLEFAQKIADVYLARLPEDKVPYWDFCDPEIPNASKDASAAAVVASALLELSTYTDGKYRAEAEAMLRSLYENYRAPEGCDSFLLHSTGHHPAGKEIDYSIVYADYYFIEALLRLKNL